jgi:hypothetical protein
MKPTRFLEARAAVLLAFALATVGCQRRSNIVLVPPDSTNAALTDSVEIALRDAQQQWDAGNAEAAAAATARLLGFEFRAREPGGWRDRAGYLLDSLGVGAEFAEGPCVLIVNFFARSDPDGGSWPFIYWCGSKGTAYQPIEGKNLRLQDLASRGLVPTGVGADSSRRVAASFIRRAPGGPQPVVMAWALPPKEPERWKLVQTLGPDSLGGFGHASFDKVVSDTDAELSARAYRTPPGFVECATCPHVFTTTRFLWTEHGFERTEFRAIPSPYATFVAFIQALVANNRAAAEQFVTDPALVPAALELDWHVKKGSWRPAPGADETPLNMTFFRGQKDAFSVHFSPRGSDWVITGFEPVDRPVD